MRTDPYRLYIAGRVGNYGFKIAYNVILDAPLVRGGLVVENVQINVGTLESGESRYVSRDIHYSGQSLSDWIIIPGYD